MINHLTLWVRNLEKSKAFYNKLLAPLGYRSMVEDSSKGVVGFGIHDVEGQRDFWIKQHPTGDFSQGTSCIAFQAQNKDQVNAFYAAGISAGGKDNGGPAYHTEYHPKYYAAFLFDPDGHNVEAVFDDL